jgi:hypothetical protein
MGGDHWFDDLARRVAGHSLSRRSMLAWTARLGLTVVGAGLVGRGSGIAGRDAGSADAVSAGPLAAPATCTVSDTYGVLNVTATASSTDPAAPMTFTHAFYAEVGSGYTMSTLTVTPGGAPGSARDDDVLVRLSTSSQADHVGTARATFGPRLTGAGVSHAQFSTDGRSGAGAVDGRGVTPVAVGTTVRAPGSADAGSGFVPSVQQGVTGLLRAVQTQPDGCAPDPTSSQPVATCTRCQLTCRGAWFDCSVGAVQSSLAAGVSAPSAYLGAASQTCDTALQQCMSTCKSGGACCPDFCQGDAACCQSAWGCCPPSPHSQQPWSQVWPTCPRCGTPPWPSSAPQSIDAGPTTTPVAGTPATGTPTQTSTATPSPTTPPSPTSTSATPTPTVGLCSPRPDIRVTTKPGGPSAPGTLLVTVSVTRSAAAPGNTLRQLRFLTIRNASVEIGNQVTSAGGFAVPTAAGTQQATFVVRRQAAGQSVTVPFSVVDDCGAWETFVGGGPAAF